MYYLWIKREVRVMFRLSAIGVVLRQPSGGHKKHESEERSGAEKGHSEFWAKCRRLVKGLQHFRAQVTQMAQIPAPARRGHGGGAQAIEAAPPSSALPPSLAGTILEAS